MMSYEVPPLPASGATQAEVFVYQLASAAPWIIDVPAATNGVESTARPITRRLIVKVVQTAVPDQAWQPRTERGRRFMALRERIVASGTRLLDLDEINQELAGGRRRSV